MPGVWIAVVAAIVIVLVVLLRPQPGRPSPRIDGRTATDADVRRLIGVDRKIEAIKLYRQLHGVGLKNAKEAVERIAAGRSPGSG
jgi:ribosomal protein L7/L12